MTHTTAGLLYRLWFDTTTMDMLTAWLPAWNRQFVEGKSKGKQGTCVVDHHGTDPGTARQRC